MPLILILSVAAAISLPGQSPERAQRPAEAKTAAEKQWPPAGTYRQGEIGVTTPRLLDDVPPNYTADAMRARITGVIRLEAVVGVDGHITDVRITKSLDRDHGLDDEALRAVRRWRFEPGTRDGVRVPVVVDIEMSFSLGK